jgi:hypothetical membrane protein
MVNRIPSWAVASATAAVVLLGVGVTLAGSLQPSRYDPVRDTISALASYGATDRWVMTSALAGLGVCHVITATGLRPARTSGRLVLGGGGVATVMVSVFAQPAHGNSRAHTAAATVALTALALWPLFATRRIRRAPLLTGPVSVGASVVLVGLVAWFAADLHGGERGLAERSAVGAEALWPLAVVVTTRWALRLSAPIGFDQPGRSGSGDAE